MQVLLIAAAVAQTFNLACSGKVETYFDGRASTETYARLYRVDLGKNSYCLDRCDRIMALAAVQPARIDFIDLEKHEVGNQRREVDTVSRETGEHFFVVESKTGGYYQQEGKGQCERQPFTGFPAFETKF